MVGSANVASAVMDFDVLEQRLIWLQRKIDLFQSKIDCSCQQDDSQEYHSLIELDQWSSKMQSKYVEVNDVRPAAIILTQCVLQFLQPGPVSEKDLRMSSITRCKDLGVKFTGKGGIAGGSMDVFTACNVLQSLGALRESLVETADVPSVDVAAADTDIFSNEPLPPSRDLMDVVPDGAFMQQAHPESGPGVQARETNTTDELIPLSNSQPSVSTDTDATPTIPMKVNRDTSSEPACPTALPITNDACCSSYSPGLVETLLTMRWEKQLKNYFKSSRKRRLAVVSPASSSVAASAAAQAAALRIMSGDCCANGGGSNGASTTPTQIQRKQRSESVTSPTAISTTTVECTGSDAVIDRELDGGEGSLSDHTPLLSPGQQLDKKGVVSGRSSQQQAFGSPRAGWAFRTFPFPKQPPGCGEANLTMQRGLDAMESDLGGIGSCQRDATAVPLGEEQLGANKDSAAQVAKVSNSSSGETLCSRPDMLKGSDATGMTGVDLANLSSTAVVPDVNTLTDTAPASNTTMNSPGTLSSSASLAESPAPPSFDPSHPLVLFAHPKEALAEWAVACYLEGLQEEREECLLRYLAGQSGLALPSSPYRLGTQFLQPDYNLSMKRSRVNVESYPPGAPSMCSAGNDIAGGDRQGVVMSFSSLLQARRSLIASSGKSGRQRGRPRGSQSTSGDGTFAPLLSRTRPRSVTNTTRDKSSDSEKDSCDPPLCMPEDRVGPQNGKIYTATELVQKAKQHQRSWPAGQKKGSQKGHGAIASRWTAEDSSSGNSSAVAWLETFPDSSPRLPGNHFYTSHAASGSVTTTGKKRARSLSSSNSTWPQGLVGVEWSGKPLVPPLMLSPSLFAPPSDDSHITTSKGLHICPDTQRQSLPDLTVLTTPIPWQSVAREFVLFNPDEPVDTPTSVSGKGAVGKGTVGAAAGSRFSWSVGTPSPRDSSRQNTAAVVPSGSVSAGSDPWQVQSPRPNSAAAACSSTPGGSGGLRITVPNPTPPSSGHGHTPCELVSTPTPAGTTRNFNGAIGAWVTAESPSADDAAAVPVSANEEADGVGVVGSQRQRRRIHRSGSSVSGEVDSMGGKVEFRRVAFADVLAPSFREISGWDGAGEDHTREEILSDNDDDNDDKIEDEDISDTAVAARHEATLSRMRSRFALIKQLKSSLKTGGSGSGGGSGGRGGHVGSPRVSGVLGGMMSLQEEREAHMTLMATAATILSSSSMSSIMSTREERRLSGGLDAVSEVAENGEDCGSSCDRGRQYEQRGLVGDLTSDGGTEGGGGSRACLNGKVCGAGNPAASILPVKSPRSKGPANLCGVIPSEPSPADRFDCREADEECIETKLGSCDSGAGGTMNSGGTSMAPPPRKRGRPPKHGLTAASSTHLPRTHGRR